MNRGNIFTKVVMLIMFLLIPIIGLYFYSNHVSNNVAGTEIKRLNKEQLSFFVNQVDTNVDHLAMMSMTLSRVQSIRDFKTIHLIKDPLDYIQIKEEVYNTIDLQSISNNWKSEIVVYAPNSEEVVSTTSSEFGIKNFDDGERKSWNYHTVKINGIEQRYFTWYTVEPWGVQQDIKDINLIIGINFSEDSLIDMLDQFKSSGRGDPFFYHPNGSTIVNRSADQQMLRKISQDIQLDIENNENNEQIIEIFNKQYLVSHVKSNKIGWYLVDYIPIDTMLSPIQSSRKLFFISVGFLLITGVFAAFLLYRHVHVPVNQLIHGVNSIRLGDYSVRIPNLRKNEFGFLIKSYNEMAHQIQILIEKVYEEKVRSNEATLKQLQSQINPHFLYNCLFFIKNMAKLGNQKSLIDMVHNLAEYYRYTTRVDQQLVTVKDEISLIENYLNIYALRMDRINYEISIPEEMMDEMILRLILQPIIENAIVHGIEPKVGEGKISIIGKIERNKNIIVIEDNGLGMACNDLKELRETINSPLNEESKSYGMWNVNQRLSLQFGEGSGLTVTVPESEGFKAYLSWNRMKE